jgi:DNA polymerase-3 subunit gamma/tau
MSYQVIARKYRPQRFADVVGQEHVTQTLANAIRSHRIAHAYLFCGPRGTGKTTVARIFAKCLNCTDGPKAEFDDDDPRCREIAEGRSLDVLEIDGASNNGVEQVRELRDTCRFAPAAGKFKIYIIDEVHMLSTAAFNALLKTLEEPPAHVKFMFATTDPEKVLPTILSRCQRFDLRRIPAALIVKHLATIAAQEAVTVEDAALYAIARGADGGMRDAESTLDQLISFCGTHIVEADVLSMFGLAARGQLLALSDALLGGDADRLLRELDELARNGKDLGRLLADLLNHFRNLLILQVTQGAAGMIEASEAEAAALQAQAGRISTEGITRVMEVLAETESRWRDAVSKKIALEVALLKAIQARHAVSLDAVLGQLKALRGTAPGPAPAEMVAGPAPAVAAMAPRPAAAVTTPPAAGEFREVAPPGLPAGTPGGTAAQTSVGPAPSAPSVGTVPGELGGTWVRLLQGAQAASRFLHSYLLKAFPVAFDRGLMTIGFPPASAHFVPLVDNRKNHELLAGLLREMGSGDVRFKFVTAEPAEPTAAPAAPPAAPPGPAPEAAATAPPLVAPVPAPGAAPLPAATEPSRALSTPTPPAGTPPAAAAGPAAAPLPEPPAGRPARPAMTRLDPATFKDDPLIKEAVEIFRGRIAQVVAPSSAAN